MLPSNHAVNASETARRSYSLGLAFNRIRDLANSGPTGRRSHRAPWRRTRRQTSAKRRMPQFDFRRPRPPSGSASSARKPSHGPRAGSRQAYRPVLPSDRERLQRLHQGKGARPCMSHRSRALRCPTGGYAAPQRTIWGRRRPIPLSGCSRMIDRQGRQKRAIWRGSFRLDTIRPRLVYSPFAMHAVRLRLFLGPDDHAAAVGRSRCAQVIPHLIE